MRAKYIKDFINEITKAENDWADEQIDNYLSTNDDYPLEKYVEKVVDYIWNRLSKKLSSEELQYTNTTKEVIEDMITLYDVPEAFYENVYDYYEEGIGFLDAAETLYELCFRRISAQGWAM